MKALLFRIVAVVIVELHRVFPKAANITVLARWDEEYVLCSEDDLPSLARFFFNYALSNPLPQATVEYVVN